MIELNMEQVNSFSGMINSGSSFIDTLQQTIGGTSIGGFWRIFSNCIPNNGIYAWNQQSTWKQYWFGYLHNDMFCFGEDIFGNQLVFFPEEENVYLWDHESARLIDMLVPAPDLLEAVLSSGFAWLDCYSNGCLEVATQVGTPSIKEHLHWTTPLILGGTVSSDNLSLVAREEHLIGHGKLWQQVADINPGTTVIPK